MPCFSAIGIARVLDYTDTKHAIERNVDKKDKTTFSELRQFMRVIPHNAQPHAVYINEKGLNTLLSESQKPEAKEFMRWVMGEVVPSIRATGSYTVEKSNKEKFDKINAQLRKLKEENKALKNNQKKKNYKAVGMIYILRPINSPNKKLLKPGKTTNFNKRLNTYNTSVPDNMEVLFTLEVDDPDAVEHCIKGLMSKYVYRKNKEYYECTIKLLKDIIMTCDNLVHGKFHCKKCGLEITSVDHFYDEHGVKMRDQLYLDFGNKQLGGSDEDNKIAIRPYPRTASDQIGGGIETGDPIILSDKPQLFDIYVSHLKAVHKICVDYLYPYFDHNTKLFFECEVGKLKGLMTQCGEEVDIDDEINVLLNDHKFKPTDKILIDTQMNEQSGGTKSNANPKFMPSDKFVEKILFLDEYILLPNGIKIMPDGKVIEPINRPSKKFR